MSLKTDMQADVDDVFLDTDDFAEAASYVPKGESSGFAVEVVPDLENDDYAEAEGFAVATDHDRAKTFFASYPLLVAGITDAVGARDPARGDIVRFATGTTFVGDWEVMTTRVDQADGVMLDCVLSEDYTERGVGA